MKGKGDYQVVVEMDAWLTDILRGRHLHPSQVVESCRVAARACGCG
jgi:hypothetical protein